MVAPVLNFNEFEKAHSALDLALKKHMISGRGRHLFDDALINRILERSARQLYGVNARARINFAWASAFTFERFVKGKEFQFAFVTFAPRRFARPLSEAAAFNQETLKSWVSERLRHRHFLATVELALYTNANVFPGSSGPMVSWHVHAIVWDKKLRVREAKLDEMNRKFTALLPGANAVDVRMYTEMEAVSRIFYATKSPLHEYRAYPLKKEIADESTGELATVLRNKFRQKKRPFRPGDAVKAFRVMGDRTIPMLVFAGGDGIAIRERALSITRSRISLQDHVRQQYLRRLLNPCATTSAKPS